jgi:membrane protease YdiL (CAAX protease family)
MQRTANFCRNCGEPNPETRRQGRGDAGDDPRRREDTHQPNTGTPDAGDKPPAGDSRSAGEDPWETDRTRRVEDSAGVADADLPQWRAALPRHVRASEESTLRVVFGAVGLALAAIFVPIVVTLVLALVAGLFVSALAPSLLTDPPVVAVAAVVIVLVLGQFAWFVGLGIWSLRRRELDREQIISYLGIEWPTARQIGLVIGTAIVMVVAAGLLSTLFLEVVELLGFDVEPAENQSTRILEENPNPALLVGGILLMFLVVGPAEELLFRGVIQGRLRERLSPGVAIAIASVVFGSIHLFALGGGGPAGIATTIAVLSTVAVALGGIYEYTGNIVVAALTHGLYNSILITGLYVTAAYDIGPEEQMTVLGVLFGVA